MSTATVIWLEPKLQLAGTTLTRVKARMASSDWVHYRGAVRRRVLDALGDRRPYFFPFKRILIWGRVP